MTDPADYINLGPVGDSIRANLEAKAEMPRVNPGAVVRSP